MPKLPTGIDKLPSGKFRARIKTKDGTSHSRTFGTVEDARTWRASLEAGNRPEEFESTNKVLPFRYYANRYVNLRRSFSPATRQMRKQQLKTKINPKLGKIRLVDINRHHIDSLVSGWQKEGLAPSTQRQLLGVVSAVLNMAVKEGIIESNPTKDIDLPRVVKRQIHPWSIETISEIRSVIPQRYKLLVTLGIGLGLRQGEIFGLAEGDIRNGYAYIERQVRIATANKLVYGPVKYNKPRRVPLPKPVEDAIQDHLAKFRPEDVVMPYDDPEGKPESHKLIMTSREHLALNRNYINTYIWRPALRKVGITPTRETGMHLLRHTYASIQLDQGVSIRALADYLGHADPGFTMRTYAHFMPENDERSRDAMNGVLYRL